MARQQTWSKTNLELFFQCPRQWFLKYGRPKKTSDTLYPSTRTSQRDISIRIARRVLYEWLEDHKNGSLWSQQFKKQQIQDITEFMFSSLKLQLETFQSKAIVQNVEHWIDSLIEHPWLSKVRHQSTSWLFFPRTESIEKHGNILYCAPDIVVYEQGVWTCVRIQFSPFQFNETTHLETLSMGIWALERPFMTEATANIRIRNISLERHQWRGVEFECGDELLERTQKLIEYDLEAMRDLKNEVMVSKSLNVLPLAKHPRICKSCPHLGVCPASKGLAEAKLEQQVLALYDLKQSKFRNKVG
jgi:hypothetical protein